MSDKPEVKEPENIPKDTSEGNIVSADKLILMKKGDYSIHLLIEEIKDLVPIEEDHWPWPVVKITCFDKQTQRTEKTSIACTDYTFNEHLYFEKTNLTIQELDSSKIILNIFDAENAKNVSDFFGIYEFDLEYIYNQPNHALKNFWLALANPESSDMAKVRGYIKLSISVWNDNDPRVEWSWKEQENSNCVLPSQIKMIYKQISWSFFYALDIPDMDNWVGSVRKVDRRCQGYVEVKYWGVIKKTSVKNMENDIITWNEVIDIPVSIPVVSQRIVLVVKDKDIAADDEIGSIEIDINEILRNQFTGYRMFCIYGSPTNDTGKYFKQMNTNPEIGSMYKGKICMKIDHRDIESPCSKTSAITDKTWLDEVKKTGETNMWSLYVKLYSAFYLPSNDEEYSIKIQIQNNSYTFQSKKNQKGYIHWNRVATLVTSTMTDKWNELPDFFITWLDSTKKPVCFQRIKPAEFYMKNEEIIVKLIPDPCIAKVKRLVDAGWWKLKNKSEYQYWDKFKDDDSAVEDEDWEAMDLESKRSIGAKSLKKYTIVAVVYMSKGLIAGDGNSKNDPFVRIKCWDNEQKTSIKYNTVNGIWNELLTFENVELDINNKSTWPILLAKVTDYDQFSQNDLLSYCYIWLSESSFSINSAETIKPKWNSLFLPQSNRQQGEWLCSFYIFDSEHKHLQSQINSKPETIDYSFELNILGWRDIKPLSLLPVKKAFIVFDMNSLNITGDSKDTWQPIKTWPKDNGANPTINAVIKFDVKLPKDEIFIPELQCEVFDHWLSGWINPCLGWFMLNWNRWIKNTKSQIKKDMDKILKVTEEYGKDEIGRKELRQSNQQNMRNSNLNNNKDNVNIEWGEYHVDEKEEMKWERKLVEGLYTQEELEANKDNSNYFVLYPQFKEYAIPGSDAKNRQKFQIEDISKVPNEAYYFAIGYLKKPKNNINLDEYQPQDNQNQTSKIIPNNTNTIEKHYRRIYRKGWEYINELNWKSPFFQSFLKRGKESDSKDENALFQEWCDDNNRIIKRYAVSAGEGGGVNQKK